MDPWAILEIEPCDDARAIKRAYAKKLKQTRPDEKPQEFQQLHAAYKQALNGAGNSRRQQAPAPQPQPVAEAVAETVTEAPPLETAPSPETRAPETAAPEAITPPICDTAAEAQQRAAEAERQKRIDEYHQILAAVDQALENPMQVSLERSWQFLAESRYMLEDEFNWNLGLGVFQRVARFNLEASKRQRNGRHQTQVTPNILTYCDQLFDWSGGRPQLYREFGEELAGAIFNVLEEQESRADPLQGVRGGKQLIREEENVTIEELEQYYFGHLLARAIALLLDIFLVYLLLGFATSVVMMKVHGASETDAGFTALMVSLAGYLLFSWLADCSRWQATPGKYLMGYRVTNRQFQRLGHVQGLWRTICFTLTVPLLKIGWLVNCFLGGNLLHDRMSRSYVINFRRGRKEYLRSRVGPPR